MSLAGCCSPHRKVIGHGSIIFVSHAMTQWVKKSTGTARNPLPILGRLRRLVPCDCRGDGAQTRRVRE